MFPSDAVVFRKNGHRSSQVIFLSMIGGMLFAVFFSLLLLLFRINLLSHAILFIVTQIVLVPGCFGFLFHNHVGNCSRSIRNSGISLKTCFLLPQRSHCDERLTLETSVLKMFFTVVAVLRY